MRADSTVAAASAPRICRPLLLALATALTAVSACGQAPVPTAQGRTPPPPGRPATSPSADARPVVRGLPPVQWKAMRDAGMWRTECPVTGKNLRRVEINHLGFDGRTHRGVLVVHEDTAGSVVRIFSRLFAARFPIRSMKPLEHFGGDNDKSLRADNTAAYNCRRPGQINAPPGESPHANGRAVDINPLENPWRDLRCRCWSPSGEHHRRSAGRGVITHGGLVWRTFTAEGWTWQNIKVPDYMHFDTGYPSRPLPSASARPGPG